MRFSVNRASDVRPGDVFDYAYTGLILVVRVEVGYEWVRFTWLNLSDGRVWNLNYMPEDLLGADLLTRTVTRENAFLHAEV